MKIINIATRNYKSINIFYIFLFLYYWINTSFAVYLSRLKYPDNSTGVIHWEGVIVDYFLNDDFIFLAPLLIFLTLLILFKYNEINFKTNISKTVLYLLSLINITYNLGPVLLILSISSYISCNISGDGGFFGCGFIFDFLSMLLCWIALLKSLASLIYLHCLKKLTNLAGR